MTYVEKAIQYNKKVIGALAAAFSSLCENGTLDESTASEHAEMFKEWAENAVYKTGDIRRHLDALYKCIQPHTSQAGWEPNVAPALWAEIEYVDGVRKIPNDPIPATKQFAKDELGWWEYNVYRSKVNGNVYSPAIAPTNWEVQN